MSKAPSESDPSKMVRNSLKPIKMARILLSHTFPQFFKHLLRRSPFSEFSLFLVPPACLFCPARVENKKKHACERPRRNAVGRLVELVGMVQPVQQRGLQVLLHVLAAEPRARAEKRFHGVACRKSEGRRRPQSFFLRRQAFFCGRCQGKASFQLVLLG